MRMLNQCKIIFFTIIISIVLLTDLVEAGTFIAYSMREAELQVKRSGSSTGEVRQIGGITRLAGLVYDKENKDLIIVGQVDKGEKPISLDDFVVALRARLTYDAWPEVSIEPKANETEKQEVRFEGGIANTHFGKDLLEADIILKEMAFGFISTDTLGIRSYSSMAIEHAKISSQPRTIATRFWFYPMDDLDIAKRDGVIAIKELRVGVRAQVLGASEKEKQITDISKVRNEVGDAFAEAVTANYKDLAAHYYPISRIKPLLDLVALAHGIKFLPSKPDMNFWLRDYKVAQVETPKDYSPLKRKEQISGTDKDYTWEMEGGVKLEVYLSRLKEDGDITAIRDIVLKAKPKGNPLTWTVPLDGWHIPGSTEAEVDEETMNDKDQKSFPSWEEPGMSLTERIFPTGTPGSTKEPPMNFKSFPPQSRLPEFKLTDRLPSQRYSPNVGGVMLRDVARISGGENAKVDLASGNFSLIVEGRNARLTPEAYRKFITALWSVYYSKQDPGISIDPIAPGVNKHRVRYIGKVINNDLGRVMREADYLMKKWAVGTERPDMPDFKNPDDIAAQTGIAYVGAMSRFWFVPEGMKFKRSNDMLLFDDGKMKVKTEFVLKNKDMRADPANEEFARFFTDQYEKISDKYPVYKELFEYAKMVSLAKYLKENGVPLFWFLMANKDIVITEDSPGTVDALAKGSDYFKGMSIEGGVDLAFEGQYVYDQQATKAIQEAVSKLSAGAPSRTTLSPGENRTKPGPEAFSFDLGKESYTVVPQHSLTSGKDRRGIRYQTDLAFRHDQGPGLELVRYYNPRGQNTGEFGKDWHLMIPYQVEPYGEEKIELLNVRIPQKMVVRNLLTGHEEVLTFNKERYSIAGYVPDRIETTDLVGLFLLSNASFRLADKLGNEFQFDQEGRLTEMIFSEEYHVKVEYGYKESKPGEFNKPPYRIEPYGSQYESFLNVHLPKKMKLVDLTNGREEMFIFARESKYGIAGYVPANESSSRYTILAIMTDGSLILNDQRGNEISFDPAGRLKGIRASVVKGLSQGDYKIELDHELIHGEPRIVEARATQGDHAGTLRVVKYEYGQDQRLARVVTPALQKSQSNPDGNYSGR